MIRLVQRRLIIPRGDTGEFEVPVLKFTEGRNVAVFSIIDLRTRSIIFKKEIEVVGESFKVEFTHDDTVNLPVGKYVWDIKIYNNPQYADENLFNGDAVDSYYAGFSLPECEIRPTGDNLLISENAPTATLSPKELDIITAAISEANSAADAATIARQLLENASASLEIVGEDDPATVTYENGNFHFEIPKVGLEEEDLDKIIAIQDEVPLSELTKIWINETQPAPVIIPTQAEMEAALALKADKVSDAVQGNFAALDANGNLVDSGHKHSDYLIEHQDISGKANISDLAAVAISGNYNDLNNKPAIPTNISQLNNDSGYLTQHQDISGKLDATLKGAINGLAELDSSGRVPAAQLPSYVDDVIEYNNSSAFPQEGESGKIYIAKDTNLTYRWGGSSYVAISSSIALGETENTAYRGDRGKIAYDHAAAKGNAYASGFYKITTNAEGHVTAAVAVEKSDITALGILDDGFAEDEEVQAIIDNYGKEDDEGMLVETTWVVPNSGDPYYETQTSADDIIAAFKAGKNVVVHFGVEEYANGDIIPSSYGISSDCYAQLNEYIAEADEESSRYDNSNPKERFYFGGSGEAYMYNIICSGERLENGYLKFYIYID